MRLSPKSLFFGLLIVGLPFAVVAGWTLGAPTVRSAALGVTGDVDGTGGLGAAPVRKGSTPDPVLPPRAAKAPADPVAAPPTPAGGVTTTVTVVASVPAPVATTTSPPQLTQPPVPTPTSIDNTPPVPTPTSESPSETPSPSASAS